MIKQGGRPIDRPDNDYAATWGDGSTADGVLFYNYSAGNNRRDVKFLETFVPAVRRQLDEVIARRATDGDKTWTAADEKELTDFYASVSRRLTFLRGINNPFSIAYVEALLWTSAADGEPGSVFETDMDGKPVGEPIPADEENFSDDAMQKIMADCGRFRALFFLELRRSGRAEQRAAAKFEDGAESQAGHDFWLQRQGTGCGFNDGDWPDGLASRLTARAEAFRAVDVYVGDDRKIHIA